MYLSPSHHFCHFLVPPQSSHVIESPPGSSDLFGENFLGFMVDQQLDMMMTDDGYVYAGVSILLITSSFSDNMKGLSALHYAASFGKISMVNALIKRVPPPPLALILREGEACERLRWERMFSALLGYLDSSQGRCRNSPRKRCWSESFEQMYRHFFRYLCSYWLGGETPLHIAALLPSPHLAELLLQNGANINARTACIFHLSFPLSHAAGETPLFFSAAQGTMASVYILLSLYLPVIDVSDSFSFLTTVILRHRMCMEIRPWIGRAQVRCSSPIPSSLSFPDYQRTRKKYLASWNKWKLLLLLVPDSITSDSVVYPPRRGVKCDLFWVNVL